MRTPVEIKPELVRIRSEILDLYRMIDEARFLTPTKEEIRSAKAFLMDLLYYLDET